MRATRDADAHPLERGHDLVDGTRDDGFTRFGIKPWRRAPRPGIVEQNPHRSPLRRHGSLRKPLAVHKGKSRNAFAGPARLGIARRARIGSADRPGDRQGVNRILKATPLIDGHNDLPEQLTENYGLKVDRLAGGSAA